MDHYLGVDVGGTKVAFRVETEDGRVEETSFGWAPRHSAGRDLAQLATHVTGLRARFGPPLRAVGVAMPATVAPDGRITVWPSRPEWTGLALGPALRTLFPGSAVAWADDGDLAALAEARAGGCADLLYAGVGTGIGGGLVRGGELCPGPGRGSFELGHVVVDLDGARCVCGRRGCLQAIASGPATLARAAELRGAPVTFDELRQGLRDERPWAAGAVGRTARALAAAVTGVGELLHPQRFVLGGGFAAGLPELAGSVAEHLAELARPGRPALPVRPATLGGRSSLRGAVALARLSG
ncbi:ROK family protein [Amycolatopsis sp. PS_44_ISF1]|uniref:ROK family protein n=1 Tax=Amycolatopsis sp. PS_44_ISF1 TaxID=2974917 RepID=UPI0028DDC198|nr:ROK family protein [Amycolatopsis sp. PS_44_ISF1]MDT8909771.1 ROK family protein [Amycolatopsis sp. PS_44_ISF1]